MTNDLKNFLESENLQFIDFLLINQPTGDEILVESKEKDTRLINFVLELVEKEVNKKPTAYFLAGEAFIRSNDIDESINSLKV